MDAVGVERTDRHDLLDLGDADTSASRGGLVEVARGLAEHEVAALIRLPALDDRQIGADAALEDIILAVELLDLFALGDLRPNTRLGIEAGNARPARAHAL